MTTRAILITTLLSLGVFGCAIDEREAEDTSDDALEVKAKDLWAGLTSYTFQRDPEDPCDNGRNLIEDAPITYDQWVRERASARNVCFEVWKPGVTDLDTSDFWKALDVRVYYRYVGAKTWTMAYVPSIDRRGNNRRYAWSIARELDPFVGYALAPSKAQLKVVSENEAFRTLGADVEFYFTINGRKLSSSKNRRFVLRFVSEVPKVAPAPWGDTP